MLRPFTRIVFSILVLSTLNFADSRRAIAVEEKPQPAVVFVSQLKPAELSDTLTYPARVTAKVNTTLLAETDGVVSKIEAPLGQRVKAGDLILTITHTDPVYQYAPAKTTSPVSGIVSVLDVNEGSQVVKGQKIGAVTNPSQIQIVVEVPAQDLSSLRRGIEGQFRISGRAEPVSARIRGISPYVDPATGTAACEIEVTGKNAQLVPGMLGQISFKTNIRKGVSIPDYAVIYRGNETFVRLVEQSKAKRVAVQLGNRQRGFVEILTQLPENSNLIERTSRSVADGDPVVVQSAETKQ